MPKFNKNLRYTANGKKFGKGVWYDDKDYPNKVRKAGDELVKYSPEIREYMKKHHIKVDGGELTTPELTTPSWNGLTMREKSDVMAAAVRNGITSLKDIRDKWNEFAEGGQMNEPPTEESQTVTAAKAKYPMLNKLDFNVYSDPNYRASDYEGYGNIETFYNGNQQVEYSPDYIYPNPRGSKNAIVYNPERIPEQYQQDAINLDAISHIGHDDATYDALNAIIASEHPDEAMWNYNNPELYQNSIDGLVREYIITKEHPNPQDPIYKELNYVQYNPKWDAHNNSPFYLGQLYDYITTGQRPPNILQEVVVKPTRQYGDGGSFNSELDWSPDSWFSLRTPKPDGTYYNDEEAAALKSHVPEYLSIEQQAKANGNWLKMPDGSTWNGDPRSWVMMQSSAFKQNYSDKPWYTGQAEWPTTYDYGNGEVATNKVTRAPYNNGQMWFSDNKDYGQTFADYTGANGIGWRMDSDTDANIKGKNFLSAIPKEGNYRTLQSDTDNPDFWMSMPYTLDNGQINRLPATDLHLDSKGRNRRNDKQKVLTDDVVNWSKDLGDQGIFLQNVEDGPIVKDGGIHENVPINEFISQPGFTNKVKFIEGNTGDFDINNPYKYAFNPVTDKLPDGTSYAAYGGHLYKRGGKVSQRNQRAGYAVDYFMNKGLSREQAAGLVGNLLRESQMNPNALNADEHGGAHGLAQWRGARWTNLQKMYGKNPTFDNQLDYIWHELNTTHKEGLRRLKASKSVDDAARNAFGYYEFSRGPENAIAQMDYYNKKRGYNNGSGRRALNDGINNAWVAYGKASPKAKLGLNVNAPTLGYQRTLPQFNFEGIGNEIADIGYNQPSSFNVGDALAQGLIPPNPTDYGTPVDYSSLIRTTEEPKEDEVFKDDNGMGLLTLMSNLGVFGEQQQEPLASYTLPKNSSPFVVSAPTYNDTLLGDSWFAKGGALYDGGGVVDMDAARQYLHNDLMSRPQTREFYKNDSEEDILAAMLADKNLITKMVADPRYQKYIKPASLPEVTVTPSATKDANGDYFNASIPQYDSAFHPEDTGKIFGTMIAPVETMAQSILADDNTRQAMQESQGLGEAGNSAFIFNPFSFTQNIMDNDGKSAVLEGAKIFLPMDNAAGHATALGLGAYGLFNENGLPKTWNYLQNGDYGNAALSGAGDVFNALMTAYGFRGAKGDFHNYMNDTGYYQLSKIPALKNWSTGKAVSSIINDEVKFANDYGLNRSFFTNPSNTARYADEPGYPNNNFVSELNWSPKNWFDYREAQLGKPKYDVEDIAALQSHLDEYYHIEQQAKANGTWLKMPDGSTWQGDPRVWVMMQSKAYKAANLTGVDHTSGITRSSINSKFDPAFHNNAWTDLEGTMSKFWADGNPPGAVLHLDYPKSAKVYEVDAKGNYYRSLPKETFFEDPGLYERVTDELVDQSTKHDYDVTRINNVMEGSGDVVTDVVIHPGTPKKSVYGNNGNFDMSDKWKTHMYKGIIPLGTLSGFSLLQNNNR